MRDVKTRRSVPARFDRARMRYSTAMRATTAVGGALAAFALASSYAPGAAMAGPKGGKVKGGDARITTQGSRTTIRQRTERVVIDWKSFDIDADEAVEFMQPGSSSVALNRVLDGLPTNIRGQLLANGNVWIVNQHGVVFHAGSVVNVGGLLATTADIANADFMAGNYRFDRPGAPDAKIINEGSITFGQAGLTAFVAPGVENRGVIAGKMGKVVIAGAETFAIDLAGDGMWAFTMGQGASGASAKTTGRIHNPGGYILISAASAAGMVDSQISVGGVVEATTAEMKGGKIVLSGDGDVQVSGRLDATGTEKGAIGGGVEITGERVHITQTAEIDASGDAGGGTIKIGGDYQGGGELKTAKRTLVEEGATIKANAIGEVGDGGEVIVWADEVTGFFGSLEAKSGSAGGLGGFAEISGKESLAFYGAVDLTGFSGNGELLLDPEVINIVATGDPLDDVELLLDPDILFGDRTGETLNISAAAIIAAGAAASVTLQATLDINVNEAVALNGSLTLQAYNNINLNADLTSANDITLTADFDGDGAGSIDFSGGGALTGANVTLFAGTDLTLGDITITTGSLTVSTSNDAISQLAGTGVQAGLFVSSFDAGTADITLDSGSNDFGDISANGARVEVADAGNLSGTPNAIRLDDIDATGDLIVSTTSGSIIQTATGISANGGIASFDAGTGDITLDAATNDFGAGGAATNINVDGSAVTINDQNDVQVTGSATTLDVTAGGTVTLGVNALPGLTVTGSTTASATNNVTLTGNYLSLGGAVYATAGGNVNGTFQNATNLYLGDVTAGGVVSLTNNSNGFRLGGAITANGGAGSITLRGGGGGGTIQTAGGLYGGDLVLAAGGAEISLAHDNDVSTLRAYANNGVTLNNASAIQLRDVTTSGDLDITASGSISTTATQTVSVTGSTSLTANGGDVTIGGSHAFTGAITASGENVGGTFNNASLIYFGALTATTGEVNFTSNNQGMRLTGDVNANAGAGYVRFRTGGTDGLIQQAGSIYAGQLSIASGGAVATLDSAGNTISTFSTVGAVGDVTLVNSAGLSLNTVTITGTFDLTTGGTVAAGGTSAVTIGEFIVDAGGYNVILPAAASVDVGSIEASNVAVLTLFDDAGGIDLAGINVTQVATISSAGGDITDSAANTVGGTTTLLATGYNITLDEANSFGTVTAAGVDLTITETDGVTLGTVGATGSLTVNAGGDITDTGAVTVTNSSDLTTSAGSITLDTATNDFGQSVSMSATGDITVVDSDGFVLGDISTSGALSITAGGNIVQAGGTTVTVGSATFYTTGTQIRVEEAGNDFTGTVTATANENIELRDANDIVLGDILSSDGYYVEVTAGGDISQAAATSITVGGAGYTSYFVSTAGSITLANAGNSFSDDVSASASTSIAITNAGSLTLSNASAGGSLTLTAGGDITTTATGTISADDLIVDAGGGNVEFLASATINVASVASSNVATLTLVDDAGGLDLAGVSAVTANITSAGGDITDSAVNDVTTINLTATGYDIVLDDANTFGSSTVNATGANITITEADDVVLGAVTATGSLTVVSQGGGISDTATQTISVTGVTDLTAAAGAGIQLDTAGHSFGQAISADGGAVELVSSGAVTLGQIDATGTLIVRAGGAIDQTATQTVNAGAAVLNSGAATTDLSNADNTFAGLVNIELARNAYVYASGNLIVGNVTTDNGSPVRNAFRSYGGDIEVTGVVNLESSVNAGVFSDLDLTAEDGIINQTGGYILARDIDATASGTIGLRRANNDFTGVASASGTSIELTDANSIELDQIAASGALVVIAGADITDGAAADISVGGSSTFNATGDITIDRANTHSFTGGVTLSANQIVNFESDNTGITFDAITTTGANLVNEVESENGVVDFAGDVTLATGADLRVRTRGDVMQSGGRIAADSLIFIHNSPNVGVTLESATNDVNSLTSRNNTGGTPADNLSFVDVDDVVLGTIDHVDVTIVAGGAVTQSNRIIASGSTTVTATGQSVTLDNAANDFGGAVSVAGSDVTLVDANQITLGAVAATGSLSVTAAYDIYDTATQTITVAGTATFSAGAGYDVDLDTAGHDFSGTVNASGASITLSDVNSIELGDIDANLLTVTAGGSITDGATGAAGEDIDVGGYAKFTASGSITLDDATHDLDNGLSLTAQTATVNLGTSILFGQVDVDDLTVTASGSITQFDDVDVANTATFTAQSGTTFFDIDLSRAGNDFNVFAATGGDISVADANAVTFGNVATNANADTTIQSVVAGSAADSGNFEVSAAGALIQNTGTILDIAGGTNIANAGNAITLTEANDFTGSVSASGQSITLVDANSIDLDQIAATGALTVTAGTDITDAATADISVGASSTFSATGDITIDRANTHSFTGGVTLSANQIVNFESDNTGITFDAITTTGANLVNEVESENGVVDFAGDVTLVTGADLRVRTRGDVTQSGGRIAADSLIFIHNSPNVGVTLESATNDVNSLTSRNNTGGTPADNLSFVDVDDVVLGTIDHVDVTIVAGGAVTQSNRIIASGSTTVTATGQSVTLDNAANDFGGAVSVAGSDVTLVDANQITLGDIDATGALNVTATAGSIDDGAETAADGDVNVTGTATFVASASITLNDETNDFGGDVNASGTTFVLADANSVTLSDIDASGSLTVTAVTGSISDNGDGAAAGDDINVAGDASFTASTTITLDDLYNDFGGAVSLSASTVTINDASAIELGTVSADDFTVTASGSITQSGVLTVTNTATFTAQSASFYDILLANAANNFGTFVATGGDISVADADGINFGDVATNANADTTINVAVAGSAAQAGNLQVSASGAVTQTSGTILDIAGGTDIANVGNAITLTEANDFTGGVAATGSDIALTDANAILLANIAASGSLTVNTTGDIGQVASTTLDIEGASSFDATTAGDVTVANAGNDFTGSVTINSAAFDIQDANDLTIASATAADGANRTNRITAGGSVTITGSATIAGTSDLSVYTGAGLDAVNVTADALYVDGGASSVTVSGTTDIVSLQVVDAGALNVSDTNGIDLAGISATSFDLVSTGAVTDSGATVVTGTTTITATGQSVTLDVATNDFGGAVNVDANDVTLVDANDIDLNVISASGTLSVTATTGDITDTDDTALITVGGASSFTAGDDIIVNREDQHTFGGEITLSADQIAEFASIGDITLGAITATNTGNVTNQIQSGGGTVTFNGVAMTAGASDLQVRLRGDVAQTSGTITTDQLIITSIGADTDATLTGDNDVRAFTVNRNAGVQLGDIVFNDVDDVDLSGVLATSLTVTAGGAVTNSGALDIEAVTTVTAAGQSVTLTNAGNDFSGTVNVIGSDVALNGAQDGIELGAIAATGSLTVTSSGTISDTASASITVSGTTSLTAQSGTNYFDIALDNDTATDRHDFTGAVSASGEDITLVAANAIELGAVSTHGDATPDDTIDVDSGAEATDPGDLVVVARGGAITDGASGSINVTGNADLTAGDGAGAYFDIALDNTGHNFDSDEADATGDGDTLRDHVTALGASITITDTTGLYVIDTQSTGAIQLTSQNGDLELRRVSGGAPGAEQSILGVAGSGTIVAEDVFGSSITLGGTGSTLGAATAATGSVTINEMIGTGDASIASATELSVEDAFIGGSLTTRAPIQRFNHVRTTAFEAGGAVDLNTDVIGDAADIDLLVLDGMTFAGDASAEAGEVRVGFLRTLNGGSLTLTATTGDVAKLADEDLDTGALTARDVTVDLARTGSATIADPNGAFTDLLNVSGDATLSAASGNVIATRGADGSTTLNADFGGTVNVTAGGYAALEDVNSITLGDVSVGADLSVRSNTDNSAGGTDGIFQAASTSITVSGTTSLITGEHDGTLNTDALASVTLGGTGNDFNDVRVLAASAALTDGNGFDIDAAFVTGDLALTGSGSLGVYDAYVGGDFSFNATGSVTVRRVAVAGASATSVAGSATLGVDIQDFTVASGATDLDATSGSIRIDDFSIQNFDFDAGTSLTISDGDMLASNGSPSTGGASVTITNVTVTDADFASASGTVTADAVRASSLSLNGAGGVRLGALAVTGDFDAASTSGSIEILDAATDAPADVNIASYGSLTFGFASGPYVSNQAGDATDPSDLRVNDNLGGGSATVIARTDFDMQVEIGGASSLTASGDVLIPREAASEGGLHNDFAGTVTISSTSGDVALETVGDITLGTVNVGGDIAIRTNSDNSAAAGSASITQTGSMTVLGDAAFITGDHGGAAGVDIALALYNPDRSDVILTNAGNDFDGSVSVVAQNAAISDNDGFTFADSRLKGDLDLDATSNAASASIIIADVKVGGSATIDAGGTIDIDRLNVQGTLGAESRSAGLDANDLNIGGNATLTASTTLSVDDAFFNGASTMIMAGATATLTDTVSRSISVEAGGLSIAGLSGEDAMFTSDDAFSGTLISTATTTINVLGGASASLTDTRVDGVLTLDANDGQAAGSVTISDLEVTGAATVDGGGVTIERMAVGGGLDIDGTGAVTATDLIAEAGPVAVDAGGAISVERFALGETTLTSGGDITLTDGRTERLTADADGRIVMRRVRGGQRITATANGDIRGDGVSSDGRSVLTSAAGNIALGAFTVGENLVAIATAGSIFTIDSDLAVGQVTVNGPEALNLPLFTVEGPDANSIGVAVSLPNSPVAERRVTETTIASPDAQSDAVGFLVDDVIIGAETPANLVSVQGVTTLTAGGDIALVDDVVGVTADNNFIGAVRVVDANNVILNDANDIALNRADVRGTMRIEAGGAITQNAGRIRVVGDALFVAGDDIILDRLNNNIGGSVALMGDDVTLAETSSIDLARVRARGDLNIIAGAGGTFDAAAITQTNTVSVADSEVATGLLADPALIQDQRSGSIIAQGDADFATGLAASVALDDGALGGNRDLTLDNRGNIFHGDLSVRRISGDATIFEESTAGTARTNGRDGGELRIANFEVGGSASLTTSDDVVFLGRMTSLLDGVSNPTKVTRPGAVSPAGQGASGIANNDLRLFISNGETFTIDTTGGGVFAAGGDVRFDRPIDGDNNAPATGTPQISQQRAGLGGLTINAGTGGEVRFRDFVGATNPLGDVNITGGDFFAGFTFAELFPSGQFNVPEPTGGANNPNAATRDPGVTPLNRYLFDGDAPNDFFFADDLTINVNGSLLAAVPPGAIDDFVQNDAYFGINVSSFTFGNTVIPSEAQAFGFITNTRQRTGGLFPVSPRSPDFQFNDCVVGDVADCTNIPTPNVVNQVLIVAPPVFDVDVEDLLELFGSFGNEELWGVPQSFFSDIGEGDDLKEECNSDEEECEEES